MRSIKSRNLFWAIIAILLSACNPSKNNQTAQTQPLQLTLYPQLTPSAAPTPIPAPSVTLAPTNNQPLPTTQPGNNSRTDIKEFYSVKCELLVDGWDCVDTYLEITFKIPFDWRMYKSTLSQGDCGGYYYSYESPRFGVFSFWGQSKDFCKPTEGTKFAGLDVPQEFCDYFSRAVRCYGINPNVALAVFYPESNEICNPEPGMFYFPTAWVVTRLDGRHKIDGLLFEREFLSVKSKDRLYQPLNAGSCKDELARKKFDEISRQLAEDLFSGKADEETTYLFQQIVNFAKSVKVK